MVIPREGVATSDSLTAIPVSSATISARTDSAGPKKPATRAAATSRVRYSIAHLKMLPIRMQLLRHYTIRGPGQTITDLFNTLIMLPFVLAPRRLAPVARAAVV